jgi:hypothetical protein
MGGNAWEVEWEEAGVQ